MKNPIIAYKDDKFYGYLIKMVPTNKHLSNGDILADEYYCVVPALKDGLSGQKWFSRIEDVPFVLEEIDIGTESFNHIKD
jgi:hypothetical protein